MLDACTAWTLATSGYLVVWDGGGRIYSRKPGFGAASLVVLETNNRRTNNRRAGERGRRLLSRPPRGYCLWIFGMHASAAVL